MKWKRKLVEEPSSPSRPGSHGAKMETSSEASSNKKPLKESKRSRDEEAQQEYQDPPASNAIAVKEQGAMSGHGLQGLVVPPLQHSSPPPLKEPGARGFLRFLNALFPFQYFFKKSSQ